MSYDNYDQQGGYDYGQQNGYYQVGQGSYEDDMEYYQNDKDYYQQNPYQQVKQQIKLQPQQLANFQPRHQFPQQPPQLSQQQPQQFTQSPPQQKQIVQPPLQQKQTIQPPSQQQYLQQQFIPQPPAPQQQQQFMQTVQQQQQQFMQTLPQQQQQFTQTLPQQQQQFTQTLPQQQQQQQPQQIKQLPQQPQQQPQQFPQSRFKQRPPVTVQKKGPSVPMRPKTVFANRQTTTPGTGMIVRPTPIQKAVVAPPPATTAATATATAVVAPQVKNTAIPASASPVLDKKAMMIIAAVKQAKLYAVAAVTADKNNDYATAVVNYRQAVNILSGEVKKAPEEDRKAFEDKILAYTRRAELIEVMNKRSASRLSKKDEHPQNDTAANSDVFKEEHISSDPYPEKLPENPYQIPYWTMRMFLKSMTTGAYITPRVYVPKVVWFQQNVKIEYCSMKLGACSPILEHFQMLRRCNLSETNAVYAELQSFTDKLNLVQNRFAQSLPYIKKPTVDEKAAKCMRKELEKGASSMTSEKSEDTSNYVHALMSIFKEAQFLEEWHKYFAESKTSPQILNLLVQVGDYFKNVLCAMVLVDLKGLIDKYMKRSLLQLSKSPL